MKYFTAFTVFFLAIIFARADQQCTESESSVVQDVVYTVNKNMPKYLQGATIIVRLADGRESSVPAERFMVVARKQKTVIGQNKTMSTSRTCKAPSRKNSVMVGVRKDHAGMNVTTKGITNGVSAKVESKKTLIPDLNYYRREILDSHLGVGAGVDSSGVVRGVLGIDF